jgi:hypothetical protein
VQSRIFAALNPGYLLWVALRGAVIVFWVMDQSSQKIQLFGS